MEVLILTIAPAMVGLTAGLHSWAESERKSLALLSVVFMSMCAVVTCSVHFTVLTLSRHAAFAGPEWQDLVFSFRWPSVVYALDILAWDLLFPLAALFAALAVHGSGPARVVRALLHGSAALAFIGLAGVPLANMNVRNIGIIGYVVLFPIAGVLLARMFRRSEASAHREQSEPRFKEAHPFQNDVLSLPVADLDTASKWYSEHFGLAEVERRDQPVPTVILERDGTRIGFAVNGGDPAQDGAAVLVSNIRAIKEELEANGSKVGKWRVDERDGQKYQVFFVVAPDGLCYYFHEPVEDTQGRVALRPLRD
jgi:catechol 2,3-dioxygenase-like lactoylglutathione lyase family enzyme